MLKRLLRHSWPQTLAAALLGRYLAFALATTRWRLVGAPGLLQTLARQPMVVAFWHERLPLMPILWHQVRAESRGSVRAHVLVSRHRDGRLIGAVVARFGLALVYGSSTRDGQDRGGAAGVRALLALLAGGSHVVITPDGPRGPRREAAAGVAEIAARSGAPVLPCAAQTTRHWTLPTWDRMLLPLPFGRGVIVCGQPLSVARGSTAARLPEIAAALTAAAEEADRQCR
jgi:hypothetical protein